MSPPRALAIIFALCCSLVAAMILTRPAVAVSAELSPVVHGWERQFEDFCRREPTDCAPNASIVEPLRWSRRLRATLRRVNSGVNLSIRMDTDEEIYGVTDFWAYPREGRGDCEDVALEKRRLLLQSGLPASAVLLVVVLDKVGGHVVLVVRTTTGDLVLDNVTENIKRLSDTGYVYVAHQDPAHQGRFIRSGLQ